MKLFPPLLSLAIVLSQENRAIPRRLLSRSSFDLGRKLALVTVVSFLAFLPAPFTATANDSEAVIGIGGIVLKKSYGIVMEKEDLLISTSEVCVSYVFRNITPTDIQTIVAFPLPPIAFSEDEYYGKLDRESSNPVDFELKVNGKPKIFKLEKKSKRGKLLVIYYWDQTFPAGERVFISHKYMPIAGGQFVGPKGHDYGARKALASEYCIMPQELDSLVYAEEVHYILRTGANWYGPIGKFTLTIKKEDPSQKVSLCGYKLWEADSMTLFFEKQKFTPKRDLKIMFY